MNTKSRLLSLALVCLILSAFIVPVPAVAQTDTMSVTEFREKFTAYTTWLDANSSPSRNLEMKVRAMSDEEFQALYESFADPDGYIALTESVMSPEVTAPTIMSASSLIAPESVSSTMTLYTPDYPHGSYYDKWIFALPGLGILSDPDQDGSYANDRCSTDGAAKLASVLAGDKAASAVADTLCNSFPDGVKIPFCIAAGVLHEIEIASEALVEQCASQDGSVDSAEIEATYENSLVISSQISIHDEQIKAILTANHNEIMDMLAENQLQLLRVEIEQELSSASNNKRVSYFYLPQAQGGLLELVRQTVLDTIDHNTAAGLSVGNAKSWFAKADASLTKGNYKDAYDSYKKAYLEAIK